MVNIDGVEPGKLKLSGKVLGDIFLGKIKKWDDNAIKALNPDVKLPSADIIVVHRSDGSGTTFGWTNYLSKVSPEWKEQVGEGKAVKWPTGQGGKGNEGVAAYVGQLKNSIGYVEYAYAKQNKLAWTQLQNKAGKFVQPEQKAFAAAAANADWKSAPGMGVVLTDEPGADSARDRRHLHPGPQVAGQAGARQGRAGLLRLGLQERRQVGRRHGLRAAARSRDQGNPRRLGRSQSADGKAVWK